MTQLPVHHFGGRDGAVLAYREMGCGRPLVLLHGFFSTASVAWIAHGHAAPLAARGHRVIMPDLRGHGDSARPRDAPSYPPDVLTDDGLALIGHLGLADYDLAGYSLGAPIVLRMLARGATPRRAVVGGAGYQQILDAKGSGRMLAAVLPHGRYVEVPGHHIGVARSPQLHEAIADYLA